MEFISDWKEEKWELQYNKMLHFCKIKLLLAKLWCLYLCSYVHHYTTKQYLIQMCYAYPPKMLAWICEAYIVLCCCYNFKCLLSTFLWELHKDEQAPSICWSLHCNTDTSWCGQVCQGHKDKNTNIPSRSGESAGYWHSLTEQRSICFRVEGEDSGYNWKPLIPTF